jgi:hypothetical protein
MKKLPPRGDLTCGLKSFRLRILLCAALCLSFALDASAQDLSEVATNEPFQLTAARLHSDWEGELNEAGWLYKTGDDERYREREYDDGAWEKLSNTQSNLAKWARSGWTGRGWFRLHVTVDEELAREIVALRFWHWGASEIYVDGKSVGRFGEITADGDREFNPHGAPVTLSFERSGEHVIAVRYSFQSSKDQSQGRGLWLARGEFNPGFYPLIQTARYAVDVYTQKGRAAGWISLFAGILCALALLHLLLFLFYRRERANLYYSFFAFSLGMSILFLAIRNLDIRMAFISGLLFVLFVVSFAVALPSLLAFLYVAFAEKLSKIFWTCLAVCLGWPSSRPFSFGHGQRFTWSVGPSS